MRNEALAESEERFRLLIEGAPDYAMFLLDPGNQIIYWSAGAERVFGWSADEVLGRSGETHLHPGRPGPETGAERNGHRPAQRRRARSPLAPAQG